MKYSTPVWEEKPSKFNKMGKQGIVYQNKRVKLIGENASGTQALKGRAMKNSAGLSNPRSVAKKF